MNKHTVLGSLSVMRVIHWLAFIAFGYIFGYAGLFKVIRLPGMVASMHSLGFNDTWILLIGWAEVLGVAGLLAGLFKPSFKNAAILWLLPFAIGALTVHISHQHTFEHYCNSLLVCILPVIVLATDGHFRIILNVKPKGWSSDE